MPHAGPAWAGHGESAGSAGESGAVQARVLQAPGPDRLRAEIPDAEHHEGGDDRENDEGDAEGEHARRRRELLWWVRRIAPAPLRLAGWQPPVRKSKLRR